MFGRKISKTILAPWAIWLLIALMLCVVVLPSQISAAVTLSKFTATWQGTQVKLNWTTGSEDQVVGFNLFRSASKDKGYSQINTSPIPSCFCTTGASYTYSDTSVALGQVYYYKLQSIGAEGPIFYDLIANANPPTPTPTPTSVSPTKTSTPTATPLSSATPTVTPTYLPSVTPPTPTATPLPSATPTVTPTYPPGVTPPTPMPSATTQRVAVAQPAATVQRATPSSNTQNSSAPVAPTNVSPSQDATSSQEVTESPEGVSDQVDQNANTEFPSSSNNNALMSGLIRVGLFVGVGLLGLGAFMFGAIAIILFVRLPHNRL